MNWQNIASYLVLALAVAYLAKRFFLPKGKSKKGNCGTDCGC